MTVFFDQPAFVAFIYPAALLKCHEEKKTKYPTRWRRFQVILGKSKFLINQIIVFDFILEIYDFIISLF